MTDEYRPVPKPPLSNPMAEAMAEDAENARVAAANAVNAAPVAEDAPAPNEAPADPTDTDAPAAIEAAPNEDPAKPSKSNEKALLGRLGHLTREKKEAIERAADLMANYVPPPRRWYDFTRPFLRIIEGMAA